MKEIKNLFDNTLLPSINMLLAHAKDLDDRFQYSPQLANDVNKIYTQLQISINAVKAELAKPN